LMTAPVALHGSRGAAPPLRWLSAGLDRRGGELPPGPGSNPGVDLVGQPRDLRASSARRPKLDGQGKLALAHPGKNGRVANAEQRENLGLGQEPRTSGDA